MTEIAGKVAFLGDFPPRQCGIATFTRDLRDAVAELHPNWSCPVIAVTDPGRRYDYPADVRFELIENDARAYVRAACSTSSDKTTIGACQSDWPTAANRRAGWERNPDPPQETETEL